MKITRSDGSPEAHAWAVVNTQPHREHVAREHLSRQAYTVYCPVVRRRVRHARRSRDALRPLFPGYVFVDVSSDLRWRPILSTVGVRGVVRSGERLSLLDDGFIRSLKEREVEGVIARPERPYAIGQQVRLVTGSFSGLVATIIEMDEKDRLVVLMDLLSRPVKVRVESLAVTSV